jgi:hypothetical protein
LAADGAERANVIEAVIGEKSQRRVEARPIVPVPPGGPEQGGPKCWELAAVVGDSVTNESNTPGRRRLNCRAENGDSYQENEAGAHVGVGEWD